MSEISKNYSLITLGWKSVDNIANIIKIACTSTLKPYELIVVVNPYNERVQVEIISFIKKSTEHLKANGILLKAGTLTHNVGVGPAWNLAMCMASQEKVIIINDDCLTASSTFEKMICALNEDPKNGMVGVEWGGNTKEDIKPTPKGFLIGFRKEMLNKIGMFKEGYAPFADERELGLRAWVAGWKCVIAENCGYYHICDFSNNPTVEIPYLENVIIPRTLQIETEPMMQSLIDDYNKILRNRNNV